MARMIPAEYVNNANAVAEERLFPLLRNNLDESWTVFHSFSMVGLNREKNRIFDAEIDFLCFHPMRGILVIEVKGGIIAYHDGRWWQYQKTIDPVGQAKRNKYNVLNFIKTKLKGDPEIPAAHAVWFPDCHGGIDNLPAEAQHITLTGRNLGFIRESVEGILGQIRPRPHPLSPGLADAIIRTLAPAFEIGSSLPDLLGHAERKIFSLTASQCELLDFIGNHKEALVEGCAGSGKTVMAVKKARQLALEGKSVLLLCYNKLLGEHLKKAVDDLDKITAITYHDFCLDFLAKLGLQPQPTTGEDSMIFWNEKLPELFASHLKDNPITYDALIVDEGQDFHEDYWISLLDLVDKDGVFYIFYDPDQNLFGTNMKLPDLGTPFTLDTNCRNCRSVFNILANYTERKMSAKVDSPEGRVEEFSSPEPTQRRGELSRVLHRLVIEEKLAEERVVILGAHSLAHTCVGDNPQVGSFRVAENGTAAKQVIPYFTFMKFKGCEADAVILLDVDPNDPRWNNNGLYTAASRAKFMLCVIRR